MSVYLDYNASAPIDDRVVDFMMDIYKNNIGNADSRTHDYGDNARTIVENARKQVALLLDIPSEDVFFTSGAILLYRDLGNMLRKQVKSILLQQA